jgi:nucleotide-binding universal stress UspA family protein
MRTVLVLTDFSKRAEHAAEFALEIAAKANAKVVLFNSFYVPQMVSAEAGVFSGYPTYQEIEKDNLMMLESLASKLEKKFVETHKSNPPTITLKNGLGDMAANVVEIAKKTKYWLIVMGDKSHDGAISRFIFGSDSYQLIDQVHCPILMLPEKIEMTAIRKIAFATELQPSDQKAIPFLRDLAEIWRSHIDVIHVCHDKLRPEEKVANFDSYKKIIAKIDYPDISYVDVRGDDVSAALAKYVSKAQVDMLAVIHKRRDFMGELLHRSISKKMMNYHSVPLLILP